MGIAACAFGIGGPLANFAGLMQMTAHSLTKSAIFFAVGHITQVKGTQRIADMGGLSITHPVLAVGLALGVIAIAGLPPFAVFTSEFGVLPELDFVETPVGMIYVATRRVGDNVWARMVENVLPICDGVTSGRYAL